MKANLLRRVLVAKATVFAGLTMMVAVVLGAASMAQAHGGDSLMFHPNHPNFVNATSQLVGSVAGPILRIDNNSTNASARALDLQVEPFRPPMTVNSSVKVTNLNSDMLDGREASSFANGVNGRANDADRLDGRDSTAFLSAAPYENRQLEVFPANTNKAVTVHCDPGDRALSGGADHIDPPSVLLETSRFGIEQAWEIEVRTGGSQDEVGVEVYCWDLPPLR